MKFVVLGWGGGGRWHLAKRQTLKMYNLIFSSLIEIFARHHVL